MGWQGWFFEEGGSYGDGEGLLSRARAPGVARGKFGRRGWKALGVPQGTP